VGTSKTSRASESSVCSSRICWTSPEVSVVDAIGDSAVAIADAVVTVTTVVVVVVVNVVDPAVV